MPSTDLVRSPSPPGGSPRHELLGLGELAADGVRGLVHHVEALHRSVAGRAFGATGVASAPVRAVHDAVSAAGYAASRMLVGAMARAPASAAAVVQPHRARALSGSPAGRMALGVLNGFLGDRLRERRNPLAARMSLRVRGADVALEPAALASAFPAATDRLALFLHGLCETEDAWLLPARGHRDQPPPSYGARLRAELGYTPLYVAYNTGLHVSENGSELSELLESLVSAWPLEVEEIALIGHSMGGLVARSACHAATAAQPGWPAALRHVICLGSPHLGASLERGANVAGWALGRVPETRHLAGVLNARSAGIKDLRFGYLCEDDWRDCDPDALLEDNRHDVPVFETATHHCAVATLGTSTDGPMATVLGDLLVGYPSATGCAREKLAIAFDEGNVRHFPGLTHFDLLNHPAVYGQLRAWLQPENEPES